MLTVSDTWLANPTLPNDILKEAVPGNIRRADFFLRVLRRLVQYLKGRLETDNVEKESPVAFVASITNQAGIDQKTLKFCYDRLHSLLMTLEITDTDEFLHIQTICDFATLVGTYARGFSIIIEPYDDRMPDVRDPIIQVVLSLLVIYFLCRGGACLVLTILEGSLIRIYMLILLEVDGNSFFIIIS